MRILVIEDDTKISSFVAKGLSQAGYAVDVAADGEAGLRRAATDPYAAAVVDLGLPGLDGLSLIEALRRKGVKLPVIILSARRSVDERVRGLRAGGDDYLAKPFSFAELLARVQALIRRSEGGGDPAQFCAGRLSLDAVKRLARWGETVLDLRPREFALLALLARHAGRPVSKTMILENVWGYDFDPQTNVVDVLVCRLREKLESATGRSWLKTVRGIGYALEVP